MEASASWWPLRRSPGSSRFRSEMADDVRPRSNHPLGSTADRPRGESLWFGTYALADVKADGRSSFHTMSARGALDLAFHFDRGCGRVCCWSRFWGWHYDGGMPVTLDLSDEVLARLQREADRRGVSLDAVIAELASTLPTASEPEERKLGFVALGASTDGRRAADADELLAEGFGRD